jgi:cell division protein FtsX
MNTLQIAALIIASILLFMSMVGVIGYIKDSTPDPIGWAKPNISTLLLILLLSMFIGFFIGYIFF